MAGLVDKKIKDSYKSILRVDDDSNGIDGSLANITDGEGTTGPFQISSTEVSFPSSSILRLANLEEESATQGFHINLTDSNGDDKNKISIPDNVDTALSIKEGDNSYIKFTTTNSSEVVEFAKNVSILTNLDVDGVSNLDVVDIDGAVDMASTLTVSGDVNFDSNTLFVDASENKVSIGTTSPLTYGGYHPAKFSVDGESFTGSIAVTEYQDGISGGLLAIGHSRGTISSKAKLNQNDIAGRLIFSGFNGADFRTITGEIRSTVTTATGSIADGVMAGNLEFRTNAGGGDDASIAMTIDSSQRVGIGTTSPSDYSTSADNLVIYDANHAGITIASPTNKSGNLFFADGTGNSDTTEHRGFIQYDHGNNATDVMSIGTAGAERLRITSDGELLLKCTSLANDFGDERGQLCISSVNHGSNNNYAVLQLQGHSNSNGVGTGAIYFYDHSNNVAIIQADRATSESSSNLLFYTNDGSSLGERMRIDSAGDVKLTKDLRVGNWDNGNSHGHAYLYLHADANEGADSGIAFMSGTTERGFIYYDHNATSASQKMVFNVGDNAVTAMTIKGDGKVGIGITSPVAQHHVKMTANEFAQVIENHNNPSNSAPYISRFRFHHTPDNGTSEFLRCDDTLSGTPVARCIISSEGDLTNHDNSYGSISDKRIKQDIKDANSQWDDIKAVKVRNFKKNDDVAQYGDKAWQQIGVIAQELEEAKMDKLVKEHPATDSEISVNDDINEGDMVKTVSYSVLYMKAIKALQEAMAKIETLESKVEALENA